MDPVYVLDVSEMAGNTQALLRGVRIWNYEILGVKMCIYLLYQS